MAKFNEEEHPRNSEGEFISKDLQGLSAEQLKQKILSEQAQKIKMTPAEKIASVHIDFDRDNILPELNAEDLEAVGSDVNKPVLLKKNIIDKNKFRHGELTAEESIQIIGQALYSEKKEIIPSKHKDKPNYFTFAKVVRTSKKDGSPICGVTLLDVDSTKNAFEIVHWHYVPYEDLASLGPKDKK